MGAPEIVVAAVAIVGLLLGSGFVVNWWQRRARLEISVFHQAMDDKYEIVITVANGGDSERHLEEIRLIPDRPPMLVDSWATGALEVLVEADLPPRGRPAKETLEVPTGWVAQRIPFRVEAKISARSKLFRSKKQNIDQAVLNVLEVDAPRRWQEVARSPRPERPE